MSTRTPEPRTSRLVAAYERLSEDTLPHLMALYDARALFKDPFNEVRGRSAVDRIFREMFEELDEPRFVIKVATCEGDQAFLTWDFQFVRRSGAPILIRGASHIEYSAEGLVQSHRDYWDAAEELYAKLPILGVLMRALQRRLGTRQPV